MPDVLSCKPRKETLTANTEGTILKDLVKDVFKIEYHANQKLRVKRRMIVTFTPNPTPLVEDGFTADDYQVTASDTDTNHPTIECTDGAAECRKIYCEVNIGKKAKGFFDVAVDAVNQNANNDDFIALKQKKLFKVERE